MKQNVNCETLLWLWTHHNMRMLSIARRDVGGRLISSFTGVVHQSHSEHGASNGLRLDIRCVRMYDSLRIISCAFLHRQTTACIRLVHSGALARITSHVNFTRKTWWWSSYDSIFCLKHNPDYNHRTTHNTSSTAQGGGGSFKSRKPIGWLLWCMDGRANALMDLSICLSICV